MWTRLLTLLTTPATDPLPGVGTYALISALCLGIGALWWAWDKERKGRLRDRDDYEKNTRELLERMLPPLTSATLTQQQNIVAMERMVRWLDDRTH